MDIKLAEINWNNLDKDTFSVIYAELVDSSKQTRKSKKLVYVNVTLDNVYCFLPQEELNKYNNETNPNKKQIIKSKLIEKFKNSDVVEL